MSSTILFVSTENEKLVNWAAENIDSRIGDSIRRSMLNYFKLELNNLRFHVAKPKTYLVTITRQGNKVKLSASYNNKHFEQVVDGLLIKRKYWLFGSYVLVNDPEYRQNA